MVNEKHSKYPVDTICNNVILIFFPKKKTFLEILDTPRSLKNKDAIRLLEKY